MTFEQLRYEVDGRILTITLNRPDRMNAFTGQMCEELIAAFDQADADDNVKVVIVTGAGRAFCAGADLELGGETWGKHSEYLAEQAAAERYVGDGGGQVTRRIYDFNKPVIAAINGAAVGVGITMTLAMDIRIAVPNAKLGFVFAARGIIPEACSSWFLPRIVGISKALEWCYSARVFKSEEGLQAGLLRSLHEPDALLPAARALAQEFIDNSSSVSIAMTRHMMWRMLSAPHPMDAHEVDTAAIAALGKSDDAREGISAFLEKRKANFKDRVTQHMPKFFPWWKDRVFKKL
ncbi:crotonase/enoyl-CoA hydratase family protein [Rhodoferax sp. UBA5149]|uniref:crotonase/enoyl-CoA hydratase family protein n=1 Tax=Rhodoferax sp. UBA5149 TaxID=1947379 RepID=UPI0025E9F42A|nr:crotonase/enoyl-CoA hydratase family protein [Rhodoferax sp. UBA5149]